MFPNYDTCSNDLELKFWQVLATDEFWPAQGGKAPDLSQVREAIDAILASQRDRNSSSKWDGKKKAWSIHLTSKFEKGLQIIELIFVPNWSATSQEWK